MGPIGVELRAPCVQSDVTGIDYETAARTIAALTDGETDPVALMATLACELHHADDRFNWTSQLLKIAPDQCGHGCPTIQILQKFVLRRRVRARRRLSRVSRPVAGYIACSASTRSEIFLPVHHGQAALLGGLDIDSDRPATFAERDAEVLGAILAAVFRPVLRRRRRIVNAFSTIADLCVNRF